MANLFLTGSGAPTSGIGEATDYYRDTVTNLIYYKDSPTNWVGVPSLIPTPDGVGTTWLYGSGEPDNGDGSPNDYYRNEDTAIVYRKDGANQWQPKGTLDFIGVYGVQWGNGLGAPANIAPLNNLPAGSFYLDVETSDIYYKDNTLEWSNKGRLGWGNVINVVNNLNSTSTTNALSANQGNALDSRLQIVENAQAGYGDIVTYNASAFDLAGAAAAATNSANNAATSATNVKNALEQMTQNKTSKLLACAIRNSGGGWSFISDTAHDPLFFAGTPTIVTAPEDFKLTLTHTTGMTKVGTLVCCPDETFAPYGVQIGASVGTNSSTLRAGMPLRFRTYGATAVADFHPFFGSRVSIAALGDGTGFTITTPQLQNGTATTMPVVGSTHYTDGRADDIQIKSLSLTSFEVRVVGDIDGYLAYNGSAWVFTSDTVANLSAAWSVDTLTITHDSTGVANLGAFLQQVFGGYRPVLVSSNANSFSVKFVNDSGVVQTSLSTAFKFRFTRPHKLPKLMLATQTCYFDCGMALLYWGDIVSANGNIWLYGLMHS